jgi:hypothetical protein
MPPKKKGMPKGILGVITKTWSGMQKISTTAKKYGLMAGSWLKAKGGRIIWIVAMHFIIGLIPILFEVNREQSCLQQEKLLIEDFKKQGYTDQDLARMGYTTAVGPSVGLSEIAKASEELP